MFLQMNWFNMEDIIPKGRDKYRIQSDNLDGYSNLKISSLLQIFQESAERQATSIGLDQKELRSQDLCYILSRINIVIDEMPILDSEVTLVTWPKSSDDQFLYRDFLLFNSSNLDKPIIRATSAWSLINIESRRAQKIELVAGSIPVSDEIFAIKEHPAKVDALPCAWNHSSGLVNSSDVDVDGNVKNTRYFEWISDVYSQEHYSEMIIGTLDINFLAEAVLGDVYKINMASKGKGIYLNNVVRESDQKELVRTRTQWIKR